MSTEVSIVRCPDYDQQTVMSAVRRVADLVGGINAFVKPGEQVLLKTNLLKARPPEAAVTTHPEAVRAVIRLVHEAGARAMVGDSPGSGDPRTIGVIMAGQDPVAIDVVCGELVGVAADVLPVVRAASSAGFGEARIENIRVRGESLSEIRVKLFRIPPREPLEWRMPEWVRRTLKDALTIRPIIDMHSCIRCGVCRSHCPRKAISDIDHNFVINYRNCIRCFCCQEFCPSGAITVGKGWMLGFTRS